MPIPETDKAILKRTSEKLQERYNTADHFMHVNPIKVKIQASPTFGFPAGVSVVSGGL